jgi:hypothetical protein
MLIYQEFLALNEELPAFDPSEKLRYAVHEIMIRLKDGVTITFVEISEILKNEFKIDISEDILKKIFEDWDKFHDPDYTVFKKEDKNWMDAYPYMKYLRRKCRDKQSFGKHRKKDVNVTYASGYYDTSGRWVPYHKSVYPGVDTDWRNPYGDMAGWD